MYGQLSLALRKRSNPLPRQTLSSIVDFILTVVRSPKQRSFYELHLNIKIFQTRHIVELGGLIYFIILDLI